MSQKGPEEVFQGAFARMSEPPRGSAMPAHRAPSRLKSRIYTAVIEEQQTSGPLESVVETKKAGHALCVFEELVQVAPVGQRAKRQFQCHVCHARKLAEAMENPPIWWPNCPYAGFKHG